MTAAARMLPLLTLQIIDGKMEVEHARMLIIAKAEAERSNTGFSKRRWNLLNAKKRIELELVQISERIG